MQKNRFVLCLTALALTLVVLFSSCAQTASSLQSPTGASPAVTETAHETTSADTESEIKTTPTGSSAGSSTGSPTESGTSSPEPTETPPPVIPDYPDPGFLAKQYFVYDLQRKAFLKIGGNDDIIYPASTIKLLTILYAKTLLPDLEEIVQPGNELDLVGENSSVAYIRKKHKLTVEQLIEGMLLPSGNDAAQVLSAAAGRVLKPDAEDGIEAVSAFLVGLNEYARSIGMTSTVVLTPDGYHREGQYSTLEDMAIVARLAYEDPVIRKYSSLPVDEVKYASGHKTTWKNTNQCIQPDSKYYIPEVNGLKTGAVDKTYNNLIVSCEIDGQSFLFGFFGEENIPNRFKDAQRAVEWTKSYVIE